MTSSNKHWNRYRYAIRSSRWTTTVLRIRGTWKESRGTLSRSKLNKFCATAVGLHLLHLRMIKQAARVRNDVNACKGIGVTLGGAYLLAMGTALGGWLLTWRTALRGCVLPWCNQRFDGRADRVD